MLSTILASRSKNTSPSLSPSSPNPSVATITTSTADDPATAALNECLEILYEVFPNGDVDNFRQLLLTTSEESRLYVAAEIVLKSKRDGARIIRGGRKLESWQKFRSTEYQEAVRTAL